MKLAIGSIDGMQFKPPARANNLPALVNDADIIRQASKSAHNIALINAREIAEFDALSNEQKQQVGKYNAAVAFKSFHGFAGTLFLSKFSTGALNSEGKDEGVKLAREVWALGLAAFSRETVVRAIESVMNGAAAGKPAYIPSLPEFVAICKSVAPRRDIQIFEIEQRASEETRKSGIEALKQLKKSISENGKAAVIKKTANISAPAFSGDYIDYILSIVERSGGDKAVALKIMDSEKGEMK